MTVSSKRTVRILARVAVATILSVGLLLVAAQTFAWGDSVVRLSLNTRDLGHRFAPGAVGLSIETQELQTGNLTVNNAPLVHLMRLLGPSVLRIGGNSVDFSLWTSHEASAPPWSGAPEGLVPNVVTPRDLRALHRLLLATNWRVLLGVDLVHGSPTRAATEARAALRILGDRLLGVELGNEPDNYRHELGVRWHAYGRKRYLAAVRTYRRAFQASTPAVAMYGPALITPKWLRHRSRSFSVFSELTMHFYAIARCVPANFSLPEDALFDAWGPENRFLRQVTTAARIAGRRLRIGETNSMACGGASGVSPVFASALWSMDWAIRAAHDGVAGLNFQSTLGLCSPRTYSPFCLPAGASATRFPGYDVHPEYYGLLAARQLEDGRFVHVVLAGQTQGFTAWATMNKAGVIRIAVCNLSPSARTVLLDSRRYAATVETLRGPMLQSTATVTFARSSITGAGVWRPKPVRLGTALGMLRLKLAAKSALVLTLKPPRRGRH